MGIGRNHGGIYHDCWRCIMPRTGPRSLTLGHVGIGSRHHPAADGGGSHPYRTGRLVGLQQPYEPEAVRGAIPAV